MGVTTHVLDTSIGRPAGGVEVRLYTLGREELADGRLVREYAEVAHGITGADGRIPGGLLAEVKRGDYCIRFEVGDYYRKRGVEGFYPSVEILFTVPGDGQHFHVPLITSPWGYSTYRGS